jgi:hypothetical protein
MDNLQLRVFCEKQTKGAAKSSHAIEAIEAATRIACNACIRASITSAIYHLPASASACFLGSCRVHLLFC